MSYMKISNVSKIYNEGDHKFAALKNINLEFEKGEFIAIIGESGCGKSTLLNLIAGLSEISKGDIYINNINIKSFNRKQKNRYLNKEVGIILQKYNLINLYNILDNINVAKNKSIDTKKTQRLLEKIGIINIKHNRLSEISGGEKQRAAFVRAIINNPSIIILDEPTGALDESNGKILLDLVSKVRDEKLIIMVTHNLEIAKNYSTRIIELRDGEVYKDVKNDADNNLINNENDYYNTHYFSIKYILIYIFNLIKRKKGRFLISIFCCIFLLFFLSLSCMSMNVINSYINMTFLSSLDANVIDLKSYEIKDKELYEIEVPTIVLNELNNDENYSIRKNLNNYLNENLLNKLIFKNNSRKINLNGIKICCMSSYHKARLKYGNIPIKPNEVVINTNLYRYLNIDNIINKRIDIENNDKYLKITGVSYSTFMNESLVIYFDYDLISSYINSININDYQIDIKDISNIDKTIDILKNNYSYSEKDQIMNKEYNYSLEYSIDLNNYYIFYDLIKMLKIVIYFFLGIASIISIVLLSNVLYSFNEEEKKNISILKILGFSNFNIGLTSIILGIFISIISFIIILIINYYINLYISPIINQYLDLNNLTLSLLLKEKMIILIVVIFISIVSSIFPLVKINNLHIDNVLREE